MNQPRTLTLARSKQALARSLIRSIVDSKVPLAIRSNSLVFKTII